MRKISPHVDIYKFPITAISSITNRVTGLALTGYFIGAGVYCLCPYQDQINKKYESLDWKLKKLISYGVIFPTTYHTFGGLRHMIWDAKPKLLQNKAVAKSSLLLIGSSLVVTVLTDYCNLLSFHK